METNTAPATLTLEDLSMMKNIIDTACTRGTFRANEMKQVGEVYERLEGFLNGIVAEAASRTEVPEETDKSIQGDSP